VDLVLSDDQRSIIASVRDVIGDAMSPAQVRQVLDGDGTALERLWRSAAELGWFGLGLSDDLGGTGFDLVDETLLFKELGRGVVPGPFLATVLGARVAALAGEAALAEGLLSGEARVGLATALSGGVHLLHDAVGAAYLLVADDEGAALFEAAAASDRAAAAGLDELTPRESCVIVGEPVAAVTASIDPIQVRGGILVSAMLVGIAEQACDLSVAYAKTREQFGSPIGTFQAVKHRCADMAVGAALADAQLLFAALSVAESHPDASFQAAAARLVAERAALSNARETVQIHGGIGVTWESDVHLYLKRVHSLAELFGGERLQRAELLAGQGTW
jgi:alkylation response protein AidB-like acyl-CoA dehydrogenase